MSLATALFLVSSVATGQAIRATPGQPEARTVIELMPAPAHLAVSTPAFRDGGDIPFENTQYRSDTFPGLTWTKGPAATQTYVLIMQDSDLLAQGAPVLHWTMFNIPVDVTSLQAGMTAPPAGALYGANYKGAAQPYTGPRTPPGGKDRYHFEIFALDATLTADAGTSYAALTRAMSGHVIASGEVVGLGEKDPSAP
ncbi:MAG TPA: YbhB/YbcL family Raf kinase inhibitor-like protein [Burkholderiaceae bacterium]|nr:YbhB/YbcL family Raf kinase inhibitor-like protein [Burkholderiaceae bacterium]